MTRRWVLPLVASVVTAACATPTTDTTSTTTPSTATEATTTTAVSTTTSQPPTTTSTSTTPAQSGGTPPTILRYGTEGLFLVDTGTETELEPNPVMVAYDDFSGGVIYRLDPNLDPDTTYWLRADGSLETLPFDPAFVALIDGAPTLAEIIPGPGDLDVDLRLTNLDSLTSRTLAGIGYTNDGWSHPSSAGGGLFVGVDTSAVGCGSSDLHIVFWNAAGESIDHPANPVPEPCDPCELGAAISPDGTLLAYSIRPDSPSEYHGRLECGGRDQWIEETASIPAEIVVVDLATGTEVFRTTAPFPSRVTDFDGRYVVVEHNDHVAPPTSTIHDITAQSPPLDLNGRGTLIHVTPGSSTLLFTADGLALEGSDGTRLVALGDAMDDAMTVLTSVLGSSATDLTEQWDEPIGIHDGFAADKVFRAVTWSGVGLTVVFSDGVEWPDGRAGPALIWWGVSTADGTPAPMLTTTGGISVGSTATRLVEVYGDNLVVRQPDEFGGWIAGPSGPEPLATIPGTSLLRFSLSGDPSRAEAVVTGMWAGTPQAP